MDAGLPVGNNQIQPLIIIFRHITSLFPKLQFLSPLSLDLNGILVVPGERGRLGDSHLSCPRFVGFFRAGMLSPGVSVKREAVLVAEYIMLLL